MYTEIRRCNEQLLFQINDIFICDIEEENYTNWSKYGQI